MATELLPQAIERSTYAITASFYDQADLAITPTSCYWMLTDDTGGVINSRSAVTVTPSTTITVSLYGADLSVPAGSPSDRDIYFTLFAKYDSATLGSSMPLRAEVKLRVRNLLNVTS